MEHAFWICEIQFVGFYVQVDQGLKYNKCVKADCKNLQNIVKKLNANQSEFNITTKNSQTVSQPD